MKKEPFNKALIYDDNCPMCKAYTKAFVKVGLLKKENRICFSNINCSKYKIDWQKAKHEIPLIDNETGEIKYGIDALAEILQQKFLFVKPFLKIGIVQWSLKKLYKLISYNRKIIVANRKQQNQNFDCTPNYNFFYRWLFVFVCNAITFFVCTYFANAKILLKLFLLIAIIFFVTNTLLHAETRKKFLLEIISQLSITGLIASIMMAATFFLQNIFFHSKIFFIASLVCVTLVVVQQLRKRILFVIKNQLLKTLCMQ